MAKSSNKKPEATSVTLQSAKKGKTKNKKTLSDTSPATPASGLRTPKIEFVSRATQQTAIVVLSHEGDARKSGARAKGKKAAPDFAAQARNALPPHLVQHPAVTGKLASRLAVHGSRPARFFWGLGSFDTLTCQEVVDNAEALGLWLNKENVSDIQLVVPQAWSDQPGSEALLFNLIKGLALSNYRLLELRSKPEKTSTLKRVQVVSPETLTLNRAELRKIEVLARGIAFARDLVELPSATATPQGIVERFRPLAESAGLEVEVWDRARIAQEGMGMLEAVSRASAREPRFLIARYTAPANSDTKLGGDESSSDDLEIQQPLYIVGKGVTFDTGGVNLKTVPYMDLLMMKKDMGGAAAVLGAILAIGHLKPARSVVALTPLTENCLSGSAVIPGDVVKSYAGKTVEIINTDAEGRLILGDAVAYAVQQGAGAIVDVATLTGACMVALGAHHTGLFTNDMELGAQVTELSDLCGEPAWPLPTSPRYAAALKSSIADIANVGSSRNGGASIGAKFIEAFVGGTPWVHLDIAGSDDLGEPAKSLAQVPAAGRMVHTLVELASLE